MTYAQQLATDLSRAMGAQPGSIAFLAMLGAISECIERCAKEAESAVCWKAGCTSKDAAAARIRALATTPAPEPGDRKER